jgi:hypothetical protein
LRSIASASLEETRADGVLLQLRKRRQHADQELQHCGPHAAGGIDAVAEGNDADAAVQERREHLLHVDGVATESIKLVDDEDGASAGLEGAPKCSGECRVSVDAPEKPASCST